MLGERLTPWSEFTTLPGFSEGGLSSAFTIELPSILIELIGDCKGRFSFSSSFLGGRDEGFGYSLGSSGFALKRTAGTFFPLIRLLVANKFEEPNLERSDLSEFPKVYPILTGAWFAPKMLALCSPPPSGLALFIGGGESSLSIN